MKVLIEVQKDSKLLYAQHHEVSDAESFGKAFASAWASLLQQQFDTETSIGALMEHLDEHMLTLLNGAEIRLSIA